jgi:hypothetical protein
LLTLKKENQKGKRERRPSSHVYSNCICIAIKHIHCRNLIATFNSESFSVSTLHRPIDWCRYWDWRSWEVSTIKFHTEMYRDGRIIPGVPAQSVLLRVPPCFPFALIEAIFLRFYIILTFFRKHLESWVLCITVDHSTPCPLYVVHWIYLETAHNNLK